MNFIDQTSKNKSIFDNNTKPMAVQRKVFSTNWNKKNKEILDKNCKKRISLSTILNITD